MNHLTRTAVAAACLATLAVGGCQSDDQPVARQDKPSSLRYEIEPFESEAGVSAETYYAAGQVHETSPVAPVSETFTAEQRERQLKVQKQLAASSYRKALDLDPEHGPSLLSLAAILTETGQYAEARAFWERYVDVTRGSAGAWANLAICLESLNDLQEAENAYREAIDADPRHKVANINLGMLLARTGRLQEATTQLSSVLDPAGVHWHLAHAHVARGDEEAARPHFRAAASLNPKYRRTTEQTDTAPQASVR